jgi:hypothetical protein
MIFTSDLTDFDSSSRQQEQQEQGLAEEEQQSPLKSPKYHHLPPHSRSQSLEHNQSRGHHRSSSSSSSFGSFYASNSSEFDSAAAAPLSPLPVSGSAVSGEAEDGMPMIQYDPSLDQFPFLPDDDSCNYKGSGSSSSSFPRYLHSLQVDLPSVSPVSLKDHSQSHNLSSHTHPRGRQQQEDEQEEEEQEAFGLFQFPPDLSLDQDPDNFLTELGFRDYEEV